MKNIIENVTILYKNRERLIYDAIQITKKGIYTGRIITKIERQKIFVDYRFIPRDKIIKITTCTEQGKIIDIDF